MGKCVRNEDNFKSVPSLKPIPEFEILCGCPCEHLIKRILPKKLCFQRQIARIEMPPVGMSSSKQVVVGKLNSAFIKPAHKRRYSLTGFVPAGQS